jgi:hypothetical protein
MNYIQKLEEVTGIKGWISQNGPQSRCGLDFFFQQGKNNHAYINNDQGFVTILVNGCCMFADFE